MGTLTDWLAVLFLASIWTIGMLTWSYIRRRKQHAPSVQTIPRSKRFGVYAMTALLGFDFGLLVRFGLRSFHGGLLIVLIAANLGLAAVIFGFRLLRPLKAGYAIKSASNSATHPRVTHRIRDFVLYCAIGIALAALAIGIGFYQAKTGSEARGLPTRWFGLLIMTALLVRFAYRAFKGFPNRRRFWSLVAIFVAAQFLLAYAVLTRFPRVTFGDFAIATIPEYFILMAYLRHFLSPKE